MLHVPRAAFVIALAVLVSGCGALFNEKDRLVTIDSTPPGAEVQLDGQRVGRTPVQLKVPNHKTSTVVVERAGYGSQICTIQAQIEPLWVILDIWFLVPLVVDAVTGRWNDVPSKCIVAFGRPHSPEPDPRPKPPAPIVDDKPTSPEHDKPKPEPDPKPKPFPFPK